MHFFIAYKDYDKEKAREAKEEFEGQGHSAFVARYDILISKEWRNEIRKHLNDCDALVAIVTDSFPNSAYANQEVGFILGKRKPVISLKFSEELPGLLDDYQAVPMSEFSVRDAVKQLVAAVEEIRTTEDRPEGPPVSILERADNALVEKIDGFKDDWPQHKFKPFRRVLVKPKSNLPKMMASPLETDDWFSNNRPGILDYTERQTTQHGLLFLSRSPRYAEISYASGEMYYGELIRGVNGVNLGKTVIIVYAMMDYAQRAYERFDYKGELLVELKVGNVKGLPLMDDSIIGLLGETYATDDNEIIVRRTMNAKDLKGPTHYVAAVITEFCRAFGFSFHKENAEGYVGRVIRE